MPCRRNMMYLITTLGFKHIHRIVDIFGFRQLVDTVTNYSFMRLQLEAHAHGKQRHARDHCAMCTKK